MPPAHQAAEFARPSYFNAIAEPAENVALDHGQASALRLPAIVGSREPIGDAPVTPPIVTPPNAEREIHANVTGDTPVEE